MHTFKLLQNEWVKLLKRSSTWVMIVLLALLTFVLAAGTSYFADSGDWKAEIEHENAVLLETAGAEDQVLINEYRLQENLAPFESSSFWGFMQDASMLYVVAILFSIIAAGSIVAGEFSTGTIKLLLIRPVKRVKILASKFLAVVLYGGMLLVVLAISSGLAGSLFFGLEALSTPDLYVKDGQVFERSMVIEIIELYGLYGVELLVYTAMAFTISTVFRSSSLAIGLSIFLMFTGPQAAMLAGRYEWAKYILFANTNLTQFIEGRPLFEGMSMTLSLLVLSGYLTLFGIISWQVFKHRDVAV